MSRILYVDFQATVSTKTISYLKAGVTAMQSTGAYDQVVFLVASPGGLVYPALEANKFIREIRVPTVAHNTGLVGSATNVVFSAAGLTYAGINSQFLLHPVTARIETCDDKFFPIELVESDCQDATDQLVYTLAEDTGVPREFVATLMSDEVILTAAEALEIGLVDGIIDPPVPTLFDDRLVIRGSYAFVMKSGKVYYKD